MAAPRTWTPSEAFRRRMEHVRKSLKLSQAQLAEMLGVHQSTVARFENGEREISLDDALRICALLGQSPVNMLVPDEITSEERRKRRISSREVSRIEITSGVSPGLNAYRAWIRGDRPLDMGDQRRWNVGRPDEEIDPALRRIAEVAEMLFDLRGFVQEAAAGQLTAQGQADALEVMKTMESLLNYERRQIERAAAKETKR